MKDDFAALGEFDGVANQVDEDLPQPTRVAQQCVWHIGGDFEHELETFLVGSQPESGDGIGQGFSEPEIRFLEIESPGFDLREIQNVVDDIDERLGGAASGLDVFALVRSQIGVQRQLEHPQHAIHRRANLVAHVGKELTLRLVGGLGSLAGAQRGNLARDQRLVCLLQLLGPNFDAFLQLPAQDTETLFALREGVKGAIFFLQALGDAARKSIAVVAHAEYHQGDGECNGVLHRAQGSRLVLPLLVLVDRPGVEIQQSMAQIHAGAEGHQDQPSEKEIERLQARQRNPDPGNGDRCLHPAGSSISFITRSMQLGQTLWVSWRSERVTRYRSTCSQ